MTTPREIYEDTFSKFDGCNPMRIKKYGEACWDAALSAAVNAPSERPDSGVKAVDIAYSDGIAVKLRAMWDLIIGAESLNQFIGKPFGEALVAQDPILKHFPKDDPSKEDPPTPDSPSWNQLAGVYNRGIKKGLKAAFDAEVESPRTGAAFFDGIQAKANAIHRLIAEPKDSRPEFRQVLAKAFLKCKAAAKKAARPGLFSPAFMEAVVEATFKRVQEIWNSDEFMQECAEKFEAAKPADQESLTQAGLDGAYRQGFKAGVEAAPANHNHDLSEGEMVIAHWGSVAAQLEAIRRLLVAPGDPPTPPPPLPIGVAFDCDPSYTQAVELAARNGYQRARSEAIQAVKRMEFDWDRPPPAGGPPDNSYATLSRVLRQLERLDPDSPPEEEARP